MIFENWFEWFPTLLSGLGVSLTLTALIAVIGFPLGLLLGLLATAPNVLVRYLFIGFIEIFRGIPLLAVIYIVYFGLPDLGMTLSSFATIVVAQSLNIGAYSSEVFRAGILHVGAGQREAALSLGITPVKIFFTIILPQAMRAVPGPLISLMIMMFQSTSLAFSIGVSEMTSRAFSIGSVTFEYLDVLVFAGLIYAVLCVTTSRIASRVEESMK